MATHDSFEWDQAKAEQNERKHGMRFETAILVFDDERTVRVDATRSSDGETRTKAIGLVDGYLTSVLFTLRGDSIRLISARRANPKEERLYGHR